MPKAAWIAIKGMREAIEFAFLLGGGATGVVGPRDVGRQKIAVGFKKVVFGFVVNPADNEVLNHSNDRFGHVAKHSVRISFCSSGGHLEEVRDGLERVSKRRIGTTGIRELEKGFSRIRFMTLAVNAAFNHLSNGIVKGNSLAKAVAKNLRDGFFGDMVD